MINTLGDSNTVGVGASNPSLSWVGRFTPKNDAVSGSQAAEISNKAIQITPTPSSKFTVMVGTNDVRNYKDNLVKKSYYEKFLRNAVCWLLYPTKVIARNMTTTGTWGNTQANSIGRVSTQQGATIQGQVSGTKVFVSYIIQNDLSAVSTANVYIDNVLEGTISCDGRTVVMNTVNGTTYAGGCSVFSVADGLHTVKIEVTSSGKNVYIDYIAGNDQLTSKVVLGNIPKYSTTGYTYYGITESVIEDYNDVINQVASEFGINVANNFTTVNPATDLADYVHLNNNGHLIVHNNFKALV